jgi:hypothetical protein
MEFVNNQLIADISIYEDRWRVITLSSTIHFDIITIIKNDDFISMFSYEEIDKLVEYFASEKNHEAVAIVMDYKARKYGFRQNGEDDLL